MSGLLRRIKRSRAAGAGENPAEEQAAGPEAAPTTAGTPAAGDATAETAELKPGATVTAPLIQADPDVPAGLDPAESAAPLATGRRGRMRRRLRYLRRARELMLRDLGGLFYEVHRTAGGDVTPHAAVIAAKVERLAGSDAEAAALEAALGAPRSEVVVFEPGIGGTCEVCGELHGSAAHFCSACGSPVGSGVRAAPAPAPAPVAEPVAEPRPVPPMPQAPATEPEPAAVAAAPEHETKVLPGEPEAPGAAPGATEQVADEPPAAEPEQAPSREAGAPAAEEPPAEAPPAEAPPAAEEAALPPAAPAGTNDPQGDRDTSSGLSNGRSDDGTPPELSSGDPLAARESGK